MTRLTVVIVFLISFTFVLAEDDKDKSVKAELVKLSGNWKMISLKIEGKDIPLKSGAEYLLTIENDKWVVRMNNSDGKPLENTFTFQIEPTKTPRTLDIIQRGSGEDAKKSIEKCIYKLDDDKLTICSPVRDGGKLDGSKERPKDFTHPDTSVIRILKRVDN